VVAKTRQFRNLYHPPYHTKLRQPAPTRSGSHHTMPRPPNEPRKPIEADYNLPEEVGLEPPSKSQRKRDMHALQDMGAELVDLAANQLDKLPLTESLRDAVDQCQKIHSHEARRRQIQFIGKILRDVDPEPLLHALEQLRQHAKLAAQKHHVLERWRDRLINEGDDALTTLLTEYPKADRQQLRHLIRTAQKETEQDKPPAAARELFRALRSLDNENS